MVLCSSGAAQVLLLLLLLPELVGVMSWPEAMRAPNHRTSTTLKTPSSIQINKAHTAGRQSATSPKPPKPP